MPVKLKNHRLTRPLNMVTEMYSLPAYGTVDPNPLMAPFFILFYGVMMADMGYGLVMLLLGGLVLWKKRPGGTLGHLCGLLDRRCEISHVLDKRLDISHLNGFLDSQISTQDHHAHIAKISYKLHDRHHHSGQELGLPGRAI